MIKIVPENMREIEDKHWEWFLSGFRNKICYYIRTKKIGEMDIDDEIINFLIDINHNEVLSVILKGKITNNNVQVNKWLKLNKKQLNKENLVELSEVKTLDQMIFCIIHKYPELFDTKNIYINAIKKIQDDIEKRDIGQIKKISGLSVKDKNEKLKPVKVHLEKNIENVLCEIIEVSGIKDKINKVKLCKVNLSGYNPLREAIKKLIAEAFSYDKNLKEETQIVLKEIFSYKAFTTVDEKSYSWDAYKLVKALDIRTCPYCNRSYTSTYIGDDGKCRPELDHYYPKSIYPFLAVSLYNFIPSCHVCNSSFKGDIDTFLIKHVYPFEEDFVNTAKFETDFFSKDDYYKKETDEKVEDYERYDVDYLLGLSDNFKINIEPIEQEYKIKNSINMFKLDKLYQFHKDYVQEIIRKSIVYNESRISELLEDFPELFKSKNDVVQFISGNYTEEKDLNKRPLSKLTRDICEEFGLK